MAAMSLGILFLVASPPGGRPPDFTPQSMRKADSVHFAWRVHYYERIIPWNRPNPILQHPQIQKCLGYTLQNGRVVFPRSMSYERRANRLVLIYTTFFSSPYVVEWCGFIPEWLTLYLKYGKAFIPLEAVSRKHKRSWILPTLWSNLTGGAGLLILKNVKRRWVMPWEKAWKAGYRSVFTGEIVETILPPDTFLGRLDKEGKVRLWSVLGPFEGASLESYSACKVPHASPLMLITYTPFAFYPHKDTLGLPGAIRNAATYRLEVMGADTLVIRWCDYLEPKEIWIIGDGEGGEKRVIRHESDTTRMAVVRQMVAELEGWVERLKRGERVEPVKIPPPKYFTD